MARTRSSKPNQPGKTSRPTIGLAAIGTLIGAGAAVFAALKLRGRDGEGHTAPDLALDKERPGADDRAPPAFRPDPEAPVPASERDALRPATLAAPVSRDHESVAVN